MEPEAWNRAIAKAVRTLRRGELVATPALSNGGGAPVERFLREVGQQQPTAILPVYCGLLAQETSTARAQQLRVVIGTSLPSGAAPEMIRREIQRLEEAICEVERAAAATKT